MNNDLRSRRKRGCRGAASLPLLVLALLAVWLVGDAIYAAVVKQRLARWEAGVSRDADGVREGCRAFTVGEGGTALLFVHGFGDSPAVFRDMAEELAARGYTCRALRLPGFAEPMDAYRETSADAWARTVAAEAEALRADHKRIVIVAHSLGGAVTLQHVMDQPDSADGVVLLSPLLGVSNKRSPLLSAERWFRIARVLMVRTDVVETIFEPHLVTEGVAPQPTDRFVPRAVYEGLFDVLDDIRARPDALRTPTRVYVSQQDPVVDPAQTERFFEGTATAEVELVPLRRSGHVVPLDGDRADVTNGIDDFARSLAEGIR